jgi:hypothetical protein
MFPSLHPFHRVKPIVLFLSALTLGGVWAVCVSPAVAAPNDKSPSPANKTPPAKTVGRSGPRATVLTSEAWQSVPFTPVQPAEIDQLIQKELQTDKIEAAPLTSDEQFLRRVTLDLTGRLPLPADVTEFVADKDPRKRAKLIDKLLASEEYAEHWARYWREVLSARLTDPRTKALAGAFEHWMKGQLAADKPWDQIARALLTADGTCHFDDDGKNGAVFFLAAHLGADAANERAAETSRIFLGIQIQCAQCHDHPLDVWKRNQFHELAAYFPRLRSQPARGENNRILGFELISAQRGEHEMPSKEDPKKTTTMHPRFLDGKAAGDNLSDHERRRALADAIVNKNNYWFAGAYVNRLWGELMGQSFYAPVDDMGPQKEAVFAPVLTRLAASFRATNYDMKEFFRAVMNSQTYQRQIRLGESTDQHLHFAAAYPTRLSADALWESLVSVLGSLGGPGGNRPRPPMAGPYAGPQGLEGLFKEEFSFDPSLKADEVEGSVSQALFMMNSPALNNRIQARGTNLLGRILTAYPDNDEALRMVYLRTLARKPTDKEIEKCRDFLKKAGSRNEAFEDILWALLNSTEFQTKR